MPFHAHLAAQGGPLTVPPRQRPRLLVRTPAQHSGESPVGFVLRVSEINGYDTPRYLFAIAGATRDETFTASLSMEKIAAVLGRDREQCAGYRASGETDSSRLHLNGHSLAARDFDVTAPKVCPECVREQGFIPSWTDLDLVDACPRHGRLLVTTCPACGEKLSWFRPAVLRCQCGAALDSARGALISAEHSSLLALVIAKAATSTHDAPSVPTLNPCGFPVAHFDKMTLRGLLSMLRSLARLSRLAGRRAQTMVASDANESVAAWAGWTCSRWPENLFSALRELVPVSNAAGRTVPLRRHMEGMYRVILKDIAAAPDIAFLRETFGAFSRSVETCPHLALPLALGPLPQLSVPPLAGPNVLPTKKRASGKRHRAPTLEGQRSFGVREVARRLDIPVSVLLYLRRVGHFEVHHKASRMVAFHEADVVAFETKVRAFCAAAPTLPATAPATVETLPLDKVLNMNFKFEDGKGELVAAIFDRTFPCFAVPAELSLRGLLLDRDATLELIGRLRASAFGDAVTPAEVSKTLYCDPLVIPSLVAAGHLVGQRHEAGLRISRDSVQRFAAEYCAVAELAKEFGTSSRALQQRVTTAGIEMFFFERGYGKGAQPFVRRNDFGRAVLLEANCSITSP